MVKSVSKQTALTPSLAMGWDFRALRCSGAGKRPPGEDFFAPSTPTRFPGEKQPDGSPHLVPDGCLRFYFSGRGGEDKPTAPPAQDGKSQHARAVFRIFGQSRADPPVPGWSGDEKTGVPCFLTDHQWHQGPSGLTIVLFLRYPPATLSPGGNPGPGLLPVTSSEPVPACTGKGASRGRREALDAAAVRWWQARFR